MRNKEVLERCIIEETKDLTIEELKCLVETLKLKNMKLEKALTDIYTKISMITKV